MCANAEPTWSYVLDVGRDPATRKRRKQQWKGGFRDPQGRRSRARRAQSARWNSGTHVAPDPQTVREWIDRWLVTMAAQDPALDAARLPQRTRPSVRSSRKREAAVAEAARRRGALRVPVAGRSSLRRRTGAEDGAKRASRCGGPSRTPSGFSRAPLSREVAIPPAGVHPKVVSERLGHATTSITLDIYSHVQPELDAEAATTVAQLFSTGK